jgi:hypothetical protein
VTARINALLFTALCVVGVVASVALTVREVARTAPIALSIADPHRTGQTTLVTVAVRNTTGTSRCVSIRVAARDRAGHDLAAVTAAHELTIPAHARRTVAARLTLTPRDYAERLHAFYPSQRPCGAA